MGPTTQSIRIGSRGSRLALVQAEWVRGRLLKVHPALTTRIVPIKTAGDTRTDRPKDAAGRKGFYTREIEQVLLQGDIDCAVHSMKDVPVEIAPACTIAAITERLDPRDVLIADHYAGLACLPQQARVGTSSLRRLTQLKHLRSDLQILPLRGNVETRIKKLQSGAFDAIILAAAGLKRLDYEELITETLSPEQMIPAAGQGALGVEVRADDLRIQEIIKCLHHEPSATAITAERCFLARLAGGCWVPISAYAVMSGETMMLRGFVADPEGQEFLMDVCAGESRAPEQLGNRLAEQLIARGAEKIVKKIMQYGAG